jgi:hypothetical protein
MHPECNTGTASGKPQPEVEAMRRILVLLPLLLGACMPAQQDCIRLATPEIQPVNRQITAAQANLQRGYALDEIERREWRWVRCGSGLPGEPPEMCFEEVTWIEIRRRAIDPAAERTRLNALLAERRVMERAAAPAIAACKAKYPA